MLHIKKQSIYPQDTDHPPTTPLTSSSTNFSPTTTTQYTQPQTILNKLLHAVEISDGQRSPPSSRRRADGKKEGGERERERGKKDNHRMPRRCATAYTASATTPVLTCRHIDIVIICKWCTHTWGEQQHPRATRVAPRGRHRERRDHRSRSVQLAVHFCFRSEDLYSEPGPAVIFLACLFQPRSPRASLSSCRACVALSLSLSIREIEMKSPD